MASLSCPLYSVLLGDSSLPGDPRFGFGATAEATGQALTGVRSYMQAVYQFSNAHAAASLFTQAHAKYAKCRSITVFVIDGADAFILNTGAGSDPSPARASPDALILRLIARVQALR